MQSPRNGAALPRPEQDMERRKREAVAGAIAAIQALRSGEQHERISTMVDRTTARLQRHHAEQTAQHPPLPQIVVTPHQDDAKWDYSDRRMDSSAPLVRSEYAQISTQAENGSWPVTQRMAD